MKRYRHCVSSVLASFLLLAGNATHAGDWPQYGGPDRNCVSRETGLLRTWPKEGPPLLWKITDLGTGMAPVSVAGQRLYTLTLRDKDELAVALDRGTGKEIWATKLSVAREAPAMSFLRQRQPLVDGERVYFFTTDGHIVCLDADAGRELWRKKYKEDFDGRYSPFGWTDNPLIDGDKLLCTPGGMSAFVVALNKTSGEVVWKTVLTGDPVNPSHAPMVAVDLAGTRQYVLNTSRMMMSVAATDGKLLWTYSKKVSNATANMAYAIPHGKQLFVTSGYGTGCALLNVTAKGDDWHVEEAYFSKEFQSLYGGLAPLGDHVYAGHGATFANTTPCCVDMRTGKLVWKQPDLAKGAVATLLADGHLYFRFADGTMVLAEATPEGFKEKGKFMQPDRTKYTAWSVPVIAHGRLFLRDQNVLLCYDLRRDSPIQKLPKDKPADPAKAGDKLDLKRQPDAVYIPTPPKVVEAMLKLAGVTRKDVVYDLGSGDGRIPIAAAQKFGARGIGIELDAELVTEARANVKKEGLEERVTIRHGDVFFEDFQDATVVTLYLLPHLNQKLLPKLKQLRPGTRIVSHAFAIEGYPADQVLRVPSADGIGEHVLYLWTTPLPKPVADWPASGRDRTPSKM